MSLIATTVERSPSLEMQELENPRLREAVGGDNWAVRYDADIERIISALEISLGRPCVHRLSDFGVGDAGEIALGVEEVALA